MMNSSATRRFCTINPRSEAIRADILRPAGSGKDGFKETSILWGILDSLRNSRFVHRRPRIIPNPGHRLNGSECCSQAFSHVGAPPRKTGNILPQRPRRSQSRVRTNSALRDLRGLCGKIDILYILLGYWRHLPGKTAPGVKILRVDALTIANDTLTSLAKTWRYEKRHCQ